jgi:hypothetical protein
MNVVVAVTASRSDGGATLARSGGVECLMEIVDHADHRLIRLAGRLTSAQVHELLEASRSSPGPVRLNLGELMSVDPVGLEVLHDLHARGALFSEVPAYIQLKLDSFSAKRNRRH